MRKTVLLILLAAACNKDKAPAPPPPPVEEKPSGIVAPPDVKAAPADAEKTASGLASKVLTKGDGTEHPAAADSVEVHYTGWTTDGSG